MHLTLREWRNDAVLDAIEAEVGPVQGKKSWFRLLGQNIFLVDYPNAVDHIEEAEKAGHVVHREAFIEGIYDKRPESLDSDPRFHHESNENYAVIERAGQFTLVLDVNWPEAVLLRHLVRRRGDDDQPLPPPPL